MLLSFQDETQRPDLLAVLFPGHPEVARGGTLADAVQDAGPEPAPALVVFLDVEGAGAELEDALQHLHGQAQALGARERAVQLDPTPPGGAREFDAWEVLADADLQVGERLVVLQLDVEAWLDVLDQAGFQEQGIDLAVGGHEINVGDELDEVGGAHVVSRGLAEVMAGAVTQVLRLADVEHAALAVFHDVDAGGGGELLDLVAGRHRLRRRRGPGFDGRDSARHGTPAGTIPSCGPVFRCGAPYLPL